MSFTVLEPTSRETPVVVEIPHAGLFVDPQTLATLIAPARSLGRDADLLVDELYADAPALGATVVVAHASRYVCDLNRAEEDLDPRAGVGGRARSSPHGLVWWSTTDGELALSTPLDQEEIRRRLDHFYRPYHRALATVVEAKRARFGFAILLCAHSMPSRPRGPGGATLGFGQPSPPPRADVVPGSRGHTTAAPIVVEAPAALARARGWTVAHDVPYQGGFTTRRYGHPERGLHAVQVELSRHRYLDEPRLCKLPNQFEQVREYCRALVARLAALDLAS